MKDVNRLRDRRSHLRTRRRALDSTVQGSKADRRQAVAAADAALAALDAELADADRRENLAVKVAAAAQLIAAAVAPGTSDLQAEADALLASDSLRELLDSPAPQLYIAAGQLLAAADALWEKAGPDAASKQPRSKKRRKATTRRRRNERAAYYEIAPGASRAEIDELLAYLRAGA
jgi:hypothetical protein